LRNDNKTISTLSLKVTE